MEKYDVFKSEGGYRVCLATWGGNPIVDQSPWHVTKEDAVKAGRKHLIKAKCLNLINDDITTLSPEFLGGHIRGTSYEIYVKYIWGLVHRKKLSEKDLVELISFIGDR